MTRLLIITGFLLLLVIGGLAVLSYTEDVVSTFATYQDAEAASALERGWMPAFVPPSARDIREVHNIDTNRQWLRFTVDEVEAERIASTMQPVSPEEARRTRTRPPRWEGAWPEEQRGGRQPSALGQVSFHRDPTPGAGARCVAIEWTSPSQVYAWSC